MRTVLTLAVVSLVLLAGCSSGDGDSSDADTSTGAASDTSTGATPDTSGGGPAATPTSSLTAAERATGFLGGQQTCSRFGGILADIAAGKLAGGARGGDTFVGETRWRIGQLGVDSLAAEPDIKRVSNDLFRTTQLPFELDDLEEGFKALNAACANNGYTTTTILGPNM
jgi:hypothetical protein